jgi:hypothetical protein
MMYFDRMDWQAISQANARRGLFRVLAVGCVIFFLLVAVGRLSNATYMQDGLWEILCKRGNFCPNRCSLRVGAFCAEVVIPNYVCRWHVTWSINAETGEVVSPLFSTNAADSLPKRDEKKRQQSQENELNRD